MEAISKAAKSVGTRGRYLLAAAPTETVISVVLALITSNAATVH
jgi:hypothetical protein